MTNNSFIYCVRDLTKCYDAGYQTTGSEDGSVVALHQVNLDIRQGEFLCVVGRSGEGKSTLLQLLGGLDTPSSGQLFFSGKPLSKIGLVRFRRDHVGFVFQMFHLLPYKNALDNVALGLILTGERSKVVRREARRWLDELGLSERVSHLPAQLSGGEKQRVAIARAMVKTPDVLLADEPTGNLDHASRDDVLTQIQRMNRTHGTTVVMVTHNIEDAQKYGHRVVTISDRTLDATLT